VNFGTIHVKNAYFWLRPAGALLLAVIVRNMELLAIKDRICTIWAKIVLRKWSSAATAKILADPVFGCFR
jgi:hypothetical protein